MLGRNSAKGKICTCERNIKTVRLRRTDVGQKQKRGRLATPEAPPDKKGRGEVIVIATCRQEPGQPCSKDPQRLLRSLPKDDRLNRTSPDPSIKSVLGSGIAAVAAVVLAKIVSRPPVALVALAAAPM